MPEAASAFDPAAQHHDVNRKIVAALERLSQVFQVLLRDEGKAAGLSPIQIQFLVHLCFHPEGFCRVGDLAREFDLTPATVSDAVSTLERKGLLTKEPDPNDRRARVLRLTAEGRQQTKVLSGWAATVREHLNGHSDSERIIVMRFLMDLIARLQAAGVITVARMCITCRFFGKDQHDDPDAPHHCILLDIPLKMRDLRIDCPEHELPAENDACP